MKFSPAQWIGAIGALVTAVSFIIVFSFTTFQTISHAKDAENWFNSRLDRIENKLDQLLEHN